MMLETNSSPSGICLCNVTHVTPHDPSTVKALANSNRLILDIIVEIDTQLSTELGLLGRDDEEVVFDVGEEVK